MTKPVDLSLLKAGTTIPKKLQDEFLEGIGVSLNKVQKYPISIIIDGEKYEATITNVDLSNPTREVVQIRYGEKSPLCQKLNEIFSYSAIDFSERKAAQQDDEARTLPDDNSEYVEVFAVGQATLEFKCHTKSAKTDFLKYLGGERDLAGYQRSYKLVFYKCFFELSKENGKVLASALTQKFQNYYIARKRAGLAADTQADNVIEDIENSSPEGVYRLILRNPYNAISNRGFILKASNEGQEYFELNTHLQHELKEQDVNEILSIVAKKLAFYYSRIDPEENAMNSLQLKRNESETSGGEEELSIKDTISNIKAYIAAKGFSYEDGLIENFYLSLKSKPFVILAGTSGTGKTRLVNLFAEAVGATSTNGRYKMVAVRPDWSDSSDLFGYVDLNGKFIPGAIIDFVKQAEIDSSRPYFLCLDEMNLARVEYYLSDVLSVIETRNFVGTRIETEPLVPEKYYGSDPSAAGRYGTIRLPENLYIIGTVNMDETTFPFSRKVLDRANTLEFSFVDLTPTFDSSETPVAAMNISNVFLKTEYLLLAQCADEAEAVGEYCSELQSINRILQTQNAHIGYRVRDEIVFYLLNNKKTNLLTQNDAMDNEIMQKILPRIQGSSASDKNMLCELFKYCAGDYEGYQTENDDISSKMIKAAKEPECKYKKSAAKIAFMVRRYEEDGFTSYWL